MAHKVDEREAMTPLSPCFFFNNLFKLSSIRRIMIDIEIHYDEEKNELMDWSYSATANIDDLIKVWKIFMEAVNLTKE